MTVGKGRPKRRRRHGRTPCNGKRIYVLMIEGGMQGGMRNVEMRLLFLVIEYHGRVD